ncbi:MAG: hypothetical protein ACRD3P_02055, partial [Terriglobales bacterium]
ERALVGTGTCFSTRAKWRALPSARISTLTKSLTPPTLSEKRFNTSDVRATPETEGWQVLVVLNYLA